MRIITRSANDTLYSMMKGLFKQDNDFEQLKQFQGWIGALEYLLHIFTNESGWIVSCDEDCFVMNEAVIEKLIEDMQFSGYDIAGVPDGGVINHRFNSWTNINPFFFVANIDAIKKKIKEYTGNETYDNLKRMPFKPLWIGEDFNHNNYEPFASLLYWIYDNSNVRFLNADVAPDGISTFVRYKSTAIAVHSWYSREFEGDHRERIMKLYENVKRLKG